MLDVVGRHGPAGLAVEDEHPRGAQRGQAAVERRPRDAVVDDRGALAAGELAHALGEAVVADRLVGARPARELGLLGGRGGRDHAPAPLLDHLGQQQPDAAGRGVDEHVVALLHRVGRDAQVVRGHALQQRGGRHLGADPVGHLHRGGRVDDDALGVAARRRGPGDPVALGEPLDALPHRHDRAGALGAGDERRVVGIGAAALALVDVAEVDARGRERDEDLAGARLGLGLVAQLEHVGPAVARDHDGAHRRARSSAARSCSARTATANRIVQRFRLRSISEPPRLPAGDADAEGAGHARVLARVQQDQEDQDDRDEDLDDGEDRSTSAQRTSLRLRRARRRISIASAAARGRAPASRPRRACRCGSRARRRGSRGTWPPCAASSSARSASSVASTRSVAGAAAR